MIQKREYFKPLIIVLLVLAMLYGVGTWGYRAGLAQGLSSSDTYEGFPGYMMMPGHSFQGSQGFGMMPGHSYGWGGHMGFGFGGFIPMIFFLIFIGFLFKIFFFAPWYGWGHRPGNWNSPEKPSDPDYTDGNDKSETSSKKA